MRPDARLHAPIKAAAQAHENNSDTAAGVGPVENGFSQGSVIRKKTAIDSIEMGIRAGKMPGLRINPTMTIHSNCGIEHHGRNRFPAKVAIFALTCTWARTWIVTLTCLLALA
jgi:hypothetical protein